MQASALSPHTLLPPEGQASVQPAGVFTCLSPAILLRALPVYHMCTEQPSG